MATQIDGRGQFATPRSASPKSSVLDAIGNFSGFPSILFRQGIAAKIGSSATVLFVCLCDHLNRKNYVQGFGVSDEQLGADTGLSTRTLRDSRRTLVTAGLITIERAPGSAYCYSIAKQPTGWVPSRERLRKKKLPRGILWASGREQASAPF